MDTNALIQELASSAAPVRRLPAPWARMLIWLALSIPFLADIWLLMPSEVSPAAAIRPSAKRTFTRLILISLQTLLF